MSARLGHRQPKISERTRIPQISTKNLQDKLENESVRKRDHSKVLTELRKRGVATA